METENPTEKHVIKCFNMLKWTTLKIDWEDKQKSGYTQKTLERILIIEHNNNDKYHNTVR
jgi:hypothetical protein